MVFPQTVLNINTQILIYGEDFGGQKKRWVDISSAVRGETGIGITAGRRNEQGKVTATNISKTLKNIDGDFSPRYPLSPYYGTLSKNIKMRHIVGIYPNLSDNFNRSVSDAWTGGTFTWTLTGGAGTDYDVDGDEGTILFTDTSTLRSGSADSQSPDHLVRAMWDVSQPDITGGVMTVEVRGRKTAASSNDNYYALRVQYSTTEQVTILLIKRVAGVETTLDTASAAINLSAIADSDLIAELYIEGNRLYGKCFRRAADEPIAWDVSATDDALTTGTFVGIGGRRDSGNTNANILIRVNEFSCIPGTIRATTEIPSFSQRWDSTGTDKHTPIQAAGLKRRLSKGQRPLNSALWRENIASNPVVMWPVNEGANSAQVGSALPEGAPMSLQATDHATDTPTTLNWSLVSYNSWLEPLASPAVGMILNMQGNIPMDSAATSWSGDYVFAIEHDADAQPYALALWQGTGTAANRTEWFYGFFNNTYEFSRTVWTAGVPASTVISDGPLEYADGRVHHARLITVRNGADVDWEILYDNTTLDSGTLAGSPWTVLAGVNGEQAAPDSGKTAMGFFTAWDHDTPPPNAANAAVVGRSGELAADRFVRLCGEEGIAYEIIGTAADTAAMGPQRLVTLLENLEACEAVDMGILYEPRHFFGFAYRTLRDLYEQTPVELDYASAHLSGNLDDSDDDFYIKNDVTLTRPEGSHARSVQETGPLNIQDPEDDPEGVGLYDVTEDYYCDLDSQLQRAAEWQKHLGTFDRQSRFPVITLELHRSEFTNDPDLLRAISNLREGDTFIIANPLSPPLAPDDLYFMVEGRGEKFANFTWEIKFNASPAGRYAVGIYDDPDNLSRYDSDRSFVTSTITTGTSTSMSVTVEDDGALWVTGSGSPEFPFDIDLLGARVRVTAISGASSPQTFTISSTVVNGINKAIPGGTVTPVRLWDDVRYGL